MEALLTSISQTGYSPTVPKIPTSLSGLTDEQLLLAISFIYQKLVCERKIPFRDIKDTEIEEKIQSFCKWSHGSAFRNSIMFQGALGNGKSTLMQSIYKLFRSADPLTFWCSSTGIYDNFVAQKNGTPSLYEEYKRAHYLFIDDLGKEPKKCFVYKNELWPIQEVIDYRYNKQLPLFISTNLDEKALLERYGERSKDRLDEMAARLYFKAQSFRPAI